MQAKEPAGCYRREVVTPRDQVRRQIDGRAAEYLDGLRVLVLNGPRQAGKTTLLHQLVAVGGGDVRSLDDDLYLRAALDDPAQFVRSDTRPLCIDEVQRGGDPLVRAVKSAVDKNNTPGQYVLAGSTRFLADPTLHESLAGRAGVLEVLPFSQSELAGTRGDFLDVTFAGDADRIRRLPVQPYTREDYLALMVRGNFPEVVRLKSARTRTAWFTTYVQAVVDGDIRAMARINEPSGVAAVLRGLAAMSGQQLVVTTLAEKADVARATVERYTELLDAVFLIHRLRPWSRNPLARAVRRPKVHLVDTGLLCHLLNVNEQSLSRIESRELGPVAETYVVNELRKQATWAETDVTLRHFRDSHGNSEVDVIAESPDARVVGIEVKAALTVTGRDFKHLDGLKAKLGTDFVHGYVVYLGTSTLSFGDRLTAVPLGALWANPPV